MHASTPASAITHDTHVHVHVHVHITMSNHPRISFTPMQHVA